MTFLIKNGKSLKSTVKGLNPEFYKSRPAK